jgi:hypothetical protein
MAPLLVNKPHTNIVPVCGRVNFSIFESPRAIAPPDRRAKAPRRGKVATRGSVIFIDQTAPITVTGRKRRRTDWRITFRSRSVSIGRRTIPFRMRTCRIYPDDNPKAMTPKVNKNLDIRPPSIP